MAGTTPKQIGIVGSGAVALALGRGLATHGYKIALGTRDKSKANLAAFVAEDPANRSIVAVKEAAEFSSRFVILATAWAGVKPSAQALQDSVAGKIVIDVTNPILPQGKQRFIGEIVPESEFDGERSGGEALQKWLGAAAPVIKAWNTVGNSVMIDPSLENGVAELPIAGDDDGAKAEVSTLLTEVGWTPVNAGTLAVSASLEHMVGLWCGMAINGGKGWAYGYAFPKQQ